MSIALDARATLSDTQVAEVIERALNTTLKDATHVDPFYGCGDILSHTTSAGSGPPSACSRTGARRSNSLYRSKTRRGSNGSRMKLQWHVWTASAWQGLSDIDDRLVGCRHVFGL